MTVNKKEFAYKLAENGEWYKKDGVKAVELFWETLMDYMAEGKTVNFQGIGSFKMKMVKGRKNAKNPKTGEPCIVPDRKKVKFYPSETLTEKIEGE